MVRFIVFRFSENRTNTSGRALFLFLRLSRRLILFLDLYSSVLMFMICLGGRVRIYISGNFSTVDPSSLAVSWASHRKRSFVWLYSWLERGGTGPRAFANQTTSRWIFRKVWTSTFGFGNLIEFCKWIIPSLFICSYRSRDRRSRCCQRRTSFKKKKRWS